MKLRTIIGLLGLASAPLASMAQAKPVTLQECLKLALANNQNIAVSRYEEQVGDQQIRQTRARALPQVNGSGNFTDNYKLQVLVLPENSFGPGTPAQVITAGLPYAAAVQAEATQTIFDASVFSALKASKAGREYYKANTRQTEEDVINQTARSFYSILASREQIRVQDSNISKLTRIITATEGNYKAGLARKIDLDRIKVSLTNAQTQRTQQLNQVSVQTNQLKVLLGVPFDNEIVPSDVSLREIEAGALEYVPNENFDVENRTEMKVLDAQIRLTNLQTKSIKAEAYPRLSAFGNYSANGISSNFGDYFKSHGSDFWYNTGAVGVRLNVPLFDGFARNARAKISNIQMMELQKRREYTELSLRSGFQNARYQMANSINTIKAQKQNVTLAEEVYSSSQVNYNLGLATLTDLLDAQTSFIQAQNSYTQALLDYKVAELETIRSAGNLRSLLQ